MASVHVRMTVKTHTVLAVTIETMTYAIAHSMSRKMRIFKKNHKLLGYIVI